jgi:AcrR family transcriptional regulator
MAVGRLTRSEQRQHNRARVLQAARAVFLERGYHGASVEQIAEAAGFSTGVVYSQFGGKADLFLALLEQRIDERARENAAAAAHLRGQDGLVRFAERASQSTLAEPEWGLLVLEFRVHAARDPELRRRYAELHTRTVRALADAIAGVLDGAADRAGLASGDLAEVFLALSTGAQLERAAGRDVLSGRLVEEVTGRLLS